MSRVFLYDFYQKYRIVYDIKNVLAAADVQKEEKLFQEWAIRRRFHDHSAGSCLLITAQHRFFLIGDAMNREHMIFEKSQKCCTFCYFGKTSIYLYAFCLRVNAEKSDFKGTGIR